MRLSPVRAYNGILLAHCLTLDQLYAEIGVVKTVLQERKDKRAAVWAGGFCLPERLPSMDHYVSAELHRICVLTQLGQYLISGEHALPMINPFVLASTDSDKKIGFDHFLVVPAEGVTSQSVKFLSSYERVTMLVKATASDGSILRKSELEDFYRCHLEVQSSELSSCFGYPKAKKFSNIPLREILPLSKLFKFDKDGCTQHSLSLVEHYLVRVLSFQVNGSEKTIAGDTLCLLMDNILHPLMDFEL